MIEEKNLVEVGFLRKPHGFKGEMNAELDYDGSLFADRLTPFIIKIDGLFVPFFIETIRKRGEGYLIKFEDVDSDSDAAMLVNHELYADRTKISELTGIEEEDLDNGFDFEGAIVRDVHSQEIIGRVNDVEEGKEYDYLVVMRENEDEEVRIPLIEPLIAAVEENEEGDIVVYVDLPDGMLDLN